VVFFLCGLWHGASWTFVVWGLYHGIFLALERTRLGAWQAKLPQSLQHLYTILVVMMGWVIFRASTFTFARHYFLALFGANSVSAAQPYIEYTTFQVLLAIGFGALFSGPTWGWIKEACGKLAQTAPVPCRRALEAVGWAAELGLMVAIFIISAAWLASGTYNPFIYFRF
jgi:alginate O-acetyltransferase complex protein AlgI